MAVTYAIKTLRPRATSNSYLTWATVRIPETDSSTYVAFSPVVLTSGKVTEAADPVVGTSLIGLATVAGLNSTSDPIATVLLAESGQSFYANLLSNSGGTNVLAVTDLGNSYDIHKSTVSSVVLWHASDTTVSTAAWMKSFHTDQTIPPSRLGNVVALDVDARVEFEWLADILAGDT